MGTAAANTKKCSKCRAVRTVDRFSRDCSRLDGLAYWCKACCNGRLRLKYARDSRWRATRVAYMRELRSGRKEARHAR